MHAKYLELLKITRHYVRNWWIFYAKDANSPTQQLFLETFFLLSLQFLVRRFEALFFGPKTPAVVTRSATPLRERQRVFCKKF